MVNLERESGYTSGLAVSPQSWFGRARSEFVVDPLDPNPDLRFPHSAAVYDAMRRTDPQVTEFIRSELGLVPVGDPRRRKRRHGIVLTEHLRTALSALAYGFSCFEQVYEYDANDRQLHLRKLGHRPATTIREIHVARDGGLVGITQEPAPSKSLKTQMTPVFIPVEKLVWYAIDQEGSDWTGTSALRSAYKPWFIKERMERLTAQIAERNGMGIPVGYHNEQGGDGDALDHQLSQLRAGATAYLNLPPNTDVKLLGVSGGTFDPLPFLDRLDQYIARALGSEFMLLGSSGSSGSYNLAETQRDHMLTACQAVADQVADVITEHVIRDLVELNFGEDAPYPVLSPGNLLSNTGVSTTEMKEMVDSGVIVPDGKLEAYWRNNKGLPEADPASAREAAPVAPVALSEPDHIAEHHRLLDRLEELRGGK